MTRKKISENWELEAGKEMQLIVEWRALLRKTEALQRLSRHKVIVVGKVG